MFDTGSNLDWDREKQMFTDTSRNRSHLLGIYDDYIEREATGIQPLSSPTWDAHWNEVFAELREGGTENPEFYIDYVQRRRAEL
jgi:hypothetical protein